MALEKDPGYIRALIVMGQARLQEGLCAEATDHLERAISNVTYASLLASCQSLSYSRAFF